MVSYSQIDPSDSCTCDLECSACLCTGEALIRRKSGKLYVDNFSQAILHIRLAAGLLEPFSLCEVSDKYSLDAGAGTIDCGISKGKVNTLCESCIAPESWCLSSAFVEKRRARRERQPPGAEGAGGAGRTERTSSGERVGYTSLGSLDKYLAGYFWHSTPSSDHDIL